MGTSRRRAGRSITTGTSGTAGRTATRSTCCTRRWSARGRSTPAGRRVHGQGDQGGQGAHLLDRPRRRLRRRLSTGSSRGILADQDFVAGAGGIPGRAPARRAGPGQLAGPDRAAADLPGRPRPLPGHRAVGPLASSTRTTAGPSTTQARHACSTRWPGPARTTALARGDEGGPKLWLIHRLLRHRRQHPGALRAGLRLRAAAGDRGAGRRTWSPSPGPAAWRVVVPRGSCSPAWRTTGPTPRSTLPGGSVDATCWAAAADRRRRRPAWPPCWRRFPVAVLARARR